MNSQISNFIDHFKSNQDINQSNVQDFINLLSSQDIHEIDIANLTSAWKIKGYKSQELVAIAQYIQDNYLDTITLDNLSTEQVIDCCGTGGDFSGSYNISTTMSIIMASMGITVAKHGGRSTTSQSGSIDFLEALKLPTLTQKEDIINSLENNNLAFIASPALHQLLGRWKGICKKLEFGGQTGLIGTLTNPVHLTHQVLGVPKHEWGNLMINALKELGRQRAIVVYGEPRLDEASLAGQTHIWELANNNIKEYSFSPQDMGLNLTSLDAIKGGSPEYNAKIFENIINNNCSQAIIDALSLNTALGLYILDKVQSIKDGISLTQSHLKENKLKKYYQELI